MEYSDLYYEIRDKFIECGLDIETLTSYPHKVTDDIDLIYKCKCGLDMTRKIRSFRKEPLCTRCRPKKDNAVRRESFAEFSKILEERGFTFADKYENFRNTKSRVLIKDKDGEEYTVTAAGFKNHMPKKIVDEAQKLSLDEVKKRVNDNGFKWIEGEKYINKSTKFNVLCHCDNIFEVCIDNLRGDRVGCTKCYMYNRKYDWDYILGFADKYGCTIISEKYVYEGRASVIEVLCPCDSHFIKSVRNFFESPRCVSCSKEKRSQTNLEKYGHENYFGSDIGKETVKNFYRENHGVEHNMQVKEIQEKAQAECLKNYGVLCILSTKDVQDKAVRAHIDKWGDRPGCVKEIREKMVRTNIERYGAKTFMVSEKGREVSKKSMTERYGFAHPMQVPEFFEKARKSSFKFKIYQLPSGKNIKIQGYEWMLMNYLLYNHKYDENDITVRAKYVPDVRYTLPGESENRRYFMDAYIKSKDIGIEVKSEWTFIREREKNRAKWFAASKICKGGFHVYVFGKNGDILGGGEIENGEITATYVGPKSKIINYKLGEWI